MGREEGRERVERGRRRWWGRCVLCILLGVVGVLVIGGGLWGGVMGTGGGESGLGEMGAGLGLGEMAGEMEKGERSEVEEVLLPEVKDKVDQDHGWEARLRGLEEL